MQRDGRRSAGVAHVVDPRRVERERLARPVAGGVDAVADHQPILVQLALDEVNGGLDALETADAARTVIAFGST